MTRIPFCFLTVALLAGGMLSSCSKPHPAAKVPPATVFPISAATETVALPADESDVFHFRIGMLDAVVLRDGDIDTPNDGKTFGVGQSLNQLTALLAMAGQPTDMLHLSIQSLLVRSDTRILLFDTGAAGVSFARGGRLSASLRAAGVEPAQVTDVFISHWHQDHIGGLLAREGTLAFPNASIHLSAPEWRTLKLDRNSAALVDAITKKVATFKPGAEILPGIVTAVAMDGHTPGHSAYEIVSGDERLLYIGDSAHHFVISVQRPEWTVAYDANAPLARIRRRALLQRAADEHLRVHAVHFPFPGLGRIKAQDDSFVWVPER